MTQPRRRQRTSIQPRGAEDHFRSRYERDVEFHRKRQREIATQIAVVGVVVGVLIAAGTVFLGNGSKKHEDLPMTQFELAAKAKAAKAASAKPKAKPSSSSKSSSSKPKSSSSDGGSGSAAKPKPAAVKTTTAAKPAAKTSAPVAAAPAPSAAKMVAAALPGTQVFQVRLGDDGFEPASITAKAHMPIRIVVDKAPSADKAGFVISDLDADADNTNEPAAVDLGSLGAGTYTYKSYDGSISGTLVVK